MAVGLRLTVTIAFSIVAAMAVPRNVRHAVLAAGVAAAWAIAAWLPFAVYWHRGVLIHLLIVLLVASPGVWPRRRWERAVVVGGYLVCLTPFVWRSDAVAIALSIALAFAAIVLTPRNPGRSSTLAAAALVLFAVLVAGGAIARLGIADLDALSIRAVTYALGMVGVAALAGLAVRPRSLGRAADAVIELGAPPDDAVRDRLAAALGDRTLTVGWWVPERDVFATAGDVQVTPPLPGGDRTGVTVEVDGRPVALVVGSTSRLDEAGVREAMRRAAALATDNARLTATLREAARDVERSRARLIRAGDDERQTLAQQLADDIGEPLMALRAALDGFDAVSASPAVTRAVDLADRALGELTDISHGLKPSALDGGLADALEVLTRRTPIPITLQVEGDIDESAAQIAYYVCAEGVANAVRYADCTAMSVRVSRTAGLSPSSFRTTGEVVLRHAQGRASLGSRRASPPAEEHSSWRRRPAAAPSSG